MNKLAVLFLITLLPQYSLALSTIWEDCSVTTYSFPYFLLREPLIKEGVSEQWVDLYINKIIAQREHANELIRENLALDIHSLAKEEQKSWALKMQRDIETIEIARNTYLGATKEENWSMTVLDLFKESASEIVSEMNIDAKFIQTTLTKCAPNLDIVNAAIERMLKKIEMGPNA